MKLNSIWVIATAMCVAGGFASSAEAITLRCDGCSSQEMKEWAILETAQGGYSYSDVFVINQTDGFVKRYSVSIDNWGQDIPDQIPDGSTSYGNASEVTVPTEVAGYLRAAIAINGTIVATGNVPNSMYDVVNNPALDKALSDYAGEADPANKNMLLNFLSSVKFIPIDFSKVTVTIEVIAADGSKATLNFDPVIKRWVRVKSETRDSGNNLIPASTGDLSGGPGTYREYQFANYNDYIKFVQQATRLGATFTGNNSTQSGVVCTSVMKEVDGQEHREQVLCSNTN